MKYVIEDDSSFVKNTINNSVINRNKDAYREYCNQKARALSDKQKIDNLQNEVSELKVMLSQILEKIK